MHPELIRQMFSEFKTRLKISASRANNNSSNFMVSIAQSLADNVVSVTNVNENRDPRQTEAAHMDKVNKVSRSVLVKLTPTQNDVLKAYKAGRQDIEARIAAKLGLTRDWRANEVLATYRSKSSEGEKVEYINELIAGQQAPLLAALFEAGLAIDLKPHQVAAFKQAYTSQHAPELVSELEAQDEVFEAANAIIKTAGEMLDTFADPLKLSEMERQIAAARQAEQALAAHM